MLGALNAKRVFDGWNPSWHYASSIAVDGHGRASDCIERGKCKNVCPQKLQIRNLLKDVAVELDSQGIE